MAQILKDFELPNVDFSNIWEKSVRNARAFCLPNVTVYCNHIMAKIAVLKSVYFFPCIFFFFNFMKESYEMKVLKISILKSEDFIMVFSM